MLLQDGGRCSYGVMLVRCLLGTFACGLKSSACNVVLRVGLALIVFRVPFLLAALVALHPFLNESYTLGTRRSAMGRLCGLQSNKPFAIQ